MYLRGLCLLCDDGGWENVFFVVPRVNHSNPLVGGEFTVRLDMRGKENGNASLVHSEFPWLKAMSLRCGLIIVL